MITIIIIPNTVIPFTIFQIIMVQVTMIPIIIISVVQIIFTLIHTNMILISVDKGWYPGEQCWHPWPRQPAFP